MDTSVPLNATYLVHNYIHRDPCRILNFDECQPKSNESNQCILCKFMKIMVSFQTQVVSPELTQMSCKLSPI